MGTTQGSQNIISTNTKNNNHKTTNNISDTFEGGILAMARELYSRYHDKLNSTELCDKLGLAFSEKLEGFDKINLEQASNKINQNKLTVNKSLIQPVLLTKKITFDIANNLEIPQVYFYDQYVSVPEGIDSAGPKLSVPYIAKHIVTILEGKSPNNINQSGGLEIVTIKKPPKRNTQKNNIPILIKNTNTGAENVLAKFETKLRDISSSPISNQENDKNIENELNNIQENIKNTTNVPEWPTKPSNKNTNNSNKNTNNSNKKVSKKELCNIISKHYMLRANLVAAITSALPLSTKNPGFCQVRINALERGYICLPPNAKKIEAMEPEDATKELSPYIKHFTKKSCDTVHGVIKTHTAEEMESIMSGTTELEQQFSRMVKSMKQKYMNTLEELKKTLEKLMNEELTNKDVQILAAATKERLNNMYTNCQLDYVLGVLALLQIDYRQPQISKEGEENLKKALELRANS